MTYGPGEKGEEAASREGEIVMNAKFPHGSPLLPILTYYACHSEVPARAMRNLMERAVTA
jgi:hypothetical protein